MLDVHVAASEYLGSTADSEEALPACVAIAASAAMASSSSSRPPPPPLPPGAASGIQPPGPTPSLPLEVTDEVRAG